MKKLLSLLLCVLLVCAASVAFADYKAGDTVTISVSVSNPNDACAFDVGFSYDKSALQFVSATGASGVAGGKNGFFFAAMSPFGGGSIGTATFKVTSNAVPGKTYTISCYNMGAYDYDDNEVSIGVSTSGGSVTIASAGCTSHVWNDGEVTTQPTCAKEGVRTYTCTNSGCGETKTESIPKLTTHTWDNGTVTTKPTCTEAGVKTYTCAVCKGTKTEAVAAAGHDDGEWITITPATCKKDGLKELQCTVCGEKLDSEVIPAAGIDHTEGKWTTTKEPTCIEEGEKALTCSVCGEVLETEAIPANGHTDGEWATTKAPTCTAEGEKTLTCSACGEELETEAIPANGHTDGEWATTKAPTCTAEGEKALTCSVCGDVLETEVVPAAGHDDGEWVTTKEATCKEDGLKELQCTICGDTLDSEVIPAADAEHVSGDMIITTAPTCTEPGEQTQSCTVCGEVLATEEVPAEGHDEGKWFVVTPATDTEVGLQELRCTKCDAVLDSAEIPVNTTGYYVRNTVCSMGPRFKDESALTDKWYRFTPVDLSADGVQTYELIGSDVNIIGYVTVTVADGTVTIDCSYVSDEVKVHSEFCTILPSLAETTTLDQAQLKNYAFGEPISIADELGGDTKVLLFICNVVDYNTDMPITRIWPNTNAFKLRIEELKENMD